MPTVLPEGYKEDFDAARALSDLARLEALEDGSIDLLLYRDRGSEVGRWRFTLYVGGRRHFAEPGASGAAESGCRGARRTALPDSASRRVDVLDLRFRAVGPRGVAPLLGARTTWTPELAAEEASAAEPKLQERFTEAFTAVWFGRAEADRFNELILRAGMSWRQAVILRAYAKYLRQAGFPYSQFHIEGVALAQSSLGVHPGRVVRSDVRPGVALTRPGRPNSKPACGSTSTPWSASTRTASCVVCSG